jgi:ribosome-binding factor A
LSGWWLLRWHRLPVELGIDDLRGSDELVRDLNTKGPSVRTLRVGEQVRHALSDVLMRGEVHDPVLASHMVSVTEVRMSPDLRHATAFVKPLLGRDEDEVLKALRTNTAFLQREVASSVKLRFAPKLKFIADESFDEGSHVDRLLRDPKVARDLAKDASDDEGAQEA